MEQVIPQYEVLLVGSGFGGLCMGARLKKAGITNFLILEKDAVMGGTWQVNDYPGAACDVPCHLYSLSFAQNANWSRKFPSQQELRDYTHSVARDCGLVPHIRLNCALQSADYDEAGGFWRLKTSQGAMTAKVLVTCLGPLSRPAIPDLPGLANFQGKTFHTSRWDHGYALQDKRIAVIGTGASAVQIVPEIAPQLAQLDLYQRTAPWILPRPDRRISAPEKWLLQHAKPLQWLYRLATYLTYEARALFFIVAPKLGAIPQMQAKSFLRKQVPDETLRAQLTPNFNIGCKRVLIINDYYPTLARPNVRLITDGIREIRAHSIVTQTGEERAVDAIVFGTGFDVQHYMGHIAIRGLGGKTLQEAGMEAYKGCAVAGFPNYFMITGPNTTLGHNSMIYMIESGANYVVDAILQLRKNGWHSVDVKPEVQARYNAKIQRKLQGTVWASGCTSWYLNQDGKNTTLWPGFTFSYRWITRRFDAANYRIQ